MSWPSILAEISKFNRKDFQQSAQYLFLDISQKYIFSHWSFMSWAHNSMKWDSNYVLKYDPLIYKFL